MSATFGAIASGSTISVTFPLNLDSKLSAITQHRLNLPFNPLRLLLSTRHRVLQHIPFDAGAPPRTT
jgi:hypothetical protein